MKRDAILSLFFNESTKHWCFKNILENAKISRPQAAEWLKKLVSEELILKVKKKGKAPYYTADYTNPKYQMKKRIFALGQLEQSGFLAHLASLPDAKAVFLFGSISRWDWYTDSDIDLFIYGDDASLDITTYEKELNREIQTFVCKNRKELEDFNPNLLHNVIRGYRVKGELNA